MQLPQHLVILVGVWMLRFPKSVMRRNGLSLIMVPPLTSSRSCHGFVGICFDIQNVEHVVAVSQSILQGLLQIALCWFQGYS